MGQLADFLVEHDPSFRKARLPALYSDFRPQRTLNPDGYQANISAWRHALSLLASSSVLPAASSTSTPFILGIDNSLLRSLEDRQFGQPLALGTAVRETISERGLVPVNDFLKAPQSVYYHGWGEVPWNVVGWTLRQIGLVDPSRGEDKLPQGRYVIMENVEKAGKDMQERMAAKTSKFERIFTKNQFRTEFATGLVGEHRLSEEDINVLLRFLSRDKGLVEYDGNIVKIKATGDQGGVTQEDETIASIKELTARLRHQIDLLNARTEELEQAAKAAVARKQRIPALAALKSKKQAEASLSSRYKTLDQLEEVAAKIEQASDQVQMMQVMESSTSVLKGLNEKVGGPERVEGVMDALRDSMADTDEVAEMLAEGGKAVDEEELGDELEAMEREEREKEEEKQRAEEEREARRKLEEVPDVPREVTPTTETGIGNLSIGERRTEEPMRN